MSGDLRLLNLLFTDCENAVAVFKGTARLELKEMKMGPLTRTSFSACFHILHVSKEGKKPDNWVLWCVWTWGPGEAEGTSYIISHNARNLCQEMCRKVFPGMLLGASVAEKTERCVCQTGSCYVLLVPCFSCVVAVLRICIEKWFINPGILTPCAVLTSTGYYYGLWLRAALRELRQICKEISENCIPTVYTVSVCFYKPSQRSFHISCFSFQAIWAFKLKTWRPEVQNSVNCGKIVINFSSFFEAECCSSHWFKCANGFVSVTCASV